MPQELFRQGDHACLMYSNLAHSELYLGTTRPQHGSPLVGDAVPQFIAWAENLVCGIDLMSEAHYRVPA